MQNNLNNDLQFLVNCCKVDPSDTDIGEIHFYLNTRLLTLLALNADTPVVKTKVGCNALIGLANQHGVLPLLYKTLKNLHEYYQPKLQSDSSDSSRNTERIAYNTLLSELKPYYMSIVQKNMLMTSELIKIIYLFREKNIEALAFKGPTLAQMAYGDITLRQYVDLDILVDEKDAFSAGKIMSENGHTGLLPLNILSNKICLHAAKDFSFMSKTDRVHTELHWQLFEKKYNIPILSWAVAKKSQTININGKAIRTLQNELLLVYLCLHGAKHAFGRIEWICDIDRLIRSSDIDWEQAMAIANEAHSKRPLYLGLSLSHHLFHTVLPLNITKNINSDDIRTLRTITLKKMSEKNNKRSDFEKNRETFFYQSKLFDKKSDMIRFYLSTFFKISTNDCQTFVLPESLKFLYIILRPIRLASRYIGRLFVA